MGVGTSEVEALVINRGFWRGRRVFVTGHTGFKGSWASLLLASFGAEVHGFALAPDNALGLFSAAHVADSVHHIIGDIRDGAVLRQAVKNSRPDIIIHMAAQALVRPSYVDPVETYATNVMGTVHLLEAARHAPDLRAIVVVTSDKCYENTGSLWGYRESDHLGGHDPYSNSKGCAELVTSAYRRSFFQQAGDAKIASGRAGNVIGGGDWSTDRLVPDAIRAFSTGQALRIRNPAAVRPWQHVLDPVMAYLQLAERLCDDAGEFDDGWNFGPAAASEVPVRRIVDGLVQLWGKDARWEHDQGEHVHEANYLKLDCTKAAAKLGWHPAVGLEEALRLTVEWYQASNDGADMRAVTLRHISEVLAAASTVSASAGLSGAVSNDRA